MRKNKNKIELLGIGLGLFLFLFIAVTAFGDKIQGFQEVEKIIKETK